MRCIVCHKHCHPSHNGLKKCCSAECRRQHRETQRLKKHPPLKQRRCGWCGHWFKPGRRNTFHCSRTCINKSAVVKRRRKLKDMALAYKGGKCQKCGYKRCKAALEFHHRNIRYKDFTMTTGNSHSWRRLKRELDKCDLLCANCHREVHYVKI